MSMGVDTSLEDLYDNTGEVADTSREYAFTAYDEKGEKKVVEFNMSTDNENDLLQPGEYLRVDHSKTLVLSYSVISEYKVPESVLNIIQ